MELKAISPGGLCPLTLQILRRRAATALARRLRVLGLAIPLGPAPLQSHQLPIPAAGTEQPTLAMGEGGDAAPPLLRRRGYNLTTSSLSLSHRHLFAPFFTW